MNNQNNNKQEPFNIVYTIKKKAVNRISYRIMGFVFLMVVAFQIFSMINGFSKHIMLTGIFAVILAFYGFYLVKMSFRNISLKGIFIYFSNLFYDILILK